MEENLSGNNPENEQIEVSPEEQENPEAKNAVVVNSLAGSVTAAQDAMVENSLVGALAAGNNLWAENSLGGALAAGNNLYFQNGGGAVLVTGNQAEVKSSMVGILVAGSEVKLEEGSKVLMTTQQAIAFGAAFGTALAVVSALLRGFRRR